MEFEAVSALLSEELGEVEVGGACGEGGEQDGTGVEAVAHEKSQPVSSRFRRETRNARKNRIGTLKMGEKWSKSQSLTFLRPTPCPCVQPFSRVTEYFSGHPSEKGDSFPNWRGEG